MGKQLPMPARERRDAIETGAGADPVEELQAERRKLIEKMGPLFAFSKVWDARRKSFRAAIMRELDVAHLKKHKKRAAVTALDNWASSDPRYIRWLDGAEEKFAELLRLENEVQSLTERINRGQALLRAYANEPRA